MDLPHPPPSTSGAGPTAVPHRRHRPHPARAARRAAAAISVGSFVVLGATFAATTHPATATTTTTTTRTGTGTGTSSGSTAADATSTSTTGTDDSWSATAGQTDSAPTAATTQSHGS